VSYLRFGCCQDGETPANGTSYEGCPESSDCSNGKFGCCPDKSTFSQGPHNQGCFDCPTEVKIDLFLKLWILEMGPDPTQAYF